MLGKGAPEIKVTENYELWELDGEWFSFNID